LAQSQPLPPFPSPNTDGAPVTYLGEGGLGLSQQQQGDREGEGGTNNPDIRKEKWTELLTLV